ncbi:MAG: DUF4198 domain-containing protein [Planctomycetaceae bacterium]|nr:DUF4198 domain-containing protein [Planctomycetaceae bacterium]
MKINFANGYEGAFQGEYKVTVDKTERQNDRKIAFIRVVDPKYNSPDTTPLGLNVSRSTKAKVDLGSAVRIEQKSYEAEQEDEINKVLKVAYPCKIIIMRDGQPVQNAEIELEPTNRSKYFHMWLEFKGTTDAQGVALITPQSSLSRMRDQGMTFPKVIPADTFQVIVKIKDDKDSDLRFGKKLEKITISDEAFEQQFDLDDYKKSRFSF